MKLLSRFSLKTKAILGGIGAGLIALLAVIVKAIGYGRRKEQQKGLEREYEIETDKIDKMAADGDADGLAADILRRTGK